GNNGNVSHRIAALLDLRRLKLDVLAFDYRGYGRSEGEPTEDGVYRDVRAALDFLVDTLEVEPSRIILFGHSLGGAIAIEGARHTDVAGLVVQSSFTHIRDMVKVLYPGTPLYLIARNQFRSLDKVPELEMPKLFVHGGDDPTIPLVLGRRLFEHAAAPKEWFEVPRAGHNDVFRHGGMRYGWRMQRFVQRCLGRS
ncbi:MAG: alpha/beta hydrolase, partial [Thermoanaerobaculia bacterium]|nr:alpha/beta hydrolase [Thermoanaerobaculia bacterium]